MSLYLLATGTLLSDPARRQGERAEFTTAKLRVQTDRDESIIVSAIAFGDAANQLAQACKGDALSVSGRARPTKWTAKDGAERHGISIVCEQIAAARPRPKAAGNRALPSRNARRQTSARHFDDRPFDDRLDDLYASGGATTI
jgi:single-stranded DNA-binding protein